MTGTRLLSVRPDSCRRIGVLRMGRIWRDSNSVSFVFKGLQGGKVSLPPIRLGRAASAICDSRPRAVDDSARRRLLACGVGFWESLATADSRHRRSKEENSTTPYFQKQISQISKSGLQMCFRTRLLVSCHSRVSGNPGPRHVRPSLDARFRGHDTDVSESSPHFQRLRRLV